MSRGRARWTYWSASTHPSRRACYNIDWFRLCCQGGWGGAFFFYIERETRWWFTHEESPGSTYRPTKSPTCVFTSILHHSGSCSRPWRQPHSLHPLSLSHSFITYPPIRNSSSSTVRIITHFVVLLLLHCKNICCNKQKVFSFLILLVYIASGGSKDSHCVCVFPSEICKQNNNK